MQETLTISEIVSFILRYRKGDAFTQETPEELHAAIQGALDEDCCVVDYDEFTHKISGVILAKAYPVRECIHIYGILCIRKCSLIRFARWLERENKRTGWKLTATRRGVAVEYDTKRILKKLTSKPYG